MKKTFALKVENKSPERQLEAIKKEIRKYIQREKNKRLPQGMDYWNLECKFGKDSDKPKVIAFTDITKSIDTAVAAGCETFYMEIISIGAIRKPREPKIKSDDE